MIELPSQGILYPDREDLEIISQISCDAVDENGVPISYIEIYEKTCECGNARCAQDKWKIVWHNDETHEEYDYDERDLVDTASVILQALSVIQNRRYFRERP